MSIISEIKDNYYHSNYNISKWVTDELTYTGEVVKVFLNYDVVQNPDQHPPGTIEVLPIQANAKKIAYPYEPGVLSLPVEKETVEVFIKSNKHYYRRKGYYGNANNSIIFQKKVGAGSKPLPDIGLRDYQSGTGGTNSTSNTIPTGNNKFKRVTLPLEYYDGDTLIQSRFGQSIRLSAYNNDTTATGGTPKEYPTILIRNRESFSNSPNTKSKTIKEDINKDGSTIAITSGKYISKFIPGLIDDKGKSNFKLEAWKGNAKYALEDYPKELSGDQIVITSGRLIFSSRSAETLFFSKGWFGIVTDEAFSIDSARGVNVVSHKGNIDIEAKEKDIILDVGKKGKIYLGRGVGGKKLYPAINGKPLIELLGRILDTMENLANMGILTSAGPTCGNSPITIAEIDKYRREMPSMLSKTVWIEE